MVIDGKNISLVYDSETEEATYALKDVNVQIREKEIIGVVGPSGSGKSSLLYVLSGLKNPSTGAVYYDDMNISFLSEENRAKLRRKKFNFIFQRHYLMEYLTVLDNVLVVLNERDEKAREIALSVLNRLGIKQLAHKKPSLLSVGQRQKAAMARALVTNSSVIFADEPTASLDHESAMEVMKIFSEIKAVTSIIFVTHDLPLLESADRIIQMSHGKIVSWR
ncbi:MAG: ABC transporter ATP-binding protein [Bacillota bacterium]|nr:ABC transporter ATP-binding protein [Bacillota bacterium]